MQLHDIQPETKNKSAKRVGRGGRRGKTSGRGHKGQKARAGGTPRPQIRDVIKKLPKLRGYRFNSRRQKPVPVNVGTLARVVSDGDEVTPTYLLERGLVEKKKGRIPPIKILGDGEIDAPITVRGCQLSASAREKIEAAGGSIDED